MSEFFKDLIPEAGSLPTYYALYELKGKDRYGGDALVRISRRDKAATAIQVRGMGIDSVDINMSFADGDYYRPVVGMYCDMVIVSRTYDRLIGLMQADETEYLVQVYENYDTIAQQLMFQGFFRPDSYRQAWQRGRALVHISATSGLGLLRHIKFTPPPVTPGFNGIDNEGPVYGRHKMAYVLSYLFYLAGNRSNWKDAVQYEWVSGGSNIPFADMPISMVEYYGLNCMEVLERIMALFETQVVILDGHITVRVPDDYADDHYRLYDYRGNYLSNESTSQRLVNIPGDVNTTGGQVTSFVPYRRLLFTKNFSPAMNLVFNGDFEKEAAGWSMSTEAPGYVNVHIIGPPIKHMRLAFLNPVEVMESEIYVRTMIDRGAPNPDIEYMRFRLEMDARCAPMIDQGSINIKVRIGGSIINKVVAASDWSPGGFTNLSFDFSLVQYIDPLYVGIYFPQSMTITSTLCIRNVRVYATTYDHLTRQRTPFSSRQEEEIVELMPASIRDATYEADSFGRSQYIWENRTPGNELRRRDGGVGRVETWKKNRMAAYYGTPRKKLIANGIVKNNVHIDAMTLVQEHDLDTTFLISSMKYGLMRKTLQLDLLQYRNYLLSYPEPPIPDPQWILANGTWNDDGIWMDTARWHDTDPNI